MRKNLIFSVALAAITLASCSNENEIMGTDAEGNVPVQVSAGIQTRAYNNLWEADDAIGVYMLNEGVTDIANKKYVTSSTTAYGSFTADGGDMYFPVDGSTRDFIAYYPYQDGVTATGSYAINLSTQTSQKNIDLMRSEKVLNKDKDNVSVAFKFYHKLVKIEVNIVGGQGLESVSLSSTGVTLTKQHLAGTFDVLTESAAAVSTDEATNEITFHPASDGSKYEAIVFPSTSTAEMEMKFLVPALSTTVPFTFAMSNAINTTSFEAGKKYIYTITINKNGESVTSTIEDWGAGNGVGDIGRAE